MSGSAVSRCGIYIAGPSMPSPALGTRGRDAAAAAAADGSR